MDEEDINHIATEVAESMRQRLAADGIVLDSDQMADALEAISGLIDHFVND